jgi:hypothetical protein
VVTSAGPSVANRSSSCFNLRPRGIRGREPAPFLRAEEREGTDGLLLAGNLLVGSCLFHLGRLEEYFIQLRTTHQILARVALQRISVRRPIHSRDACSRLSVGVAWGSQEPAVLRVGPDHHCSQHVP